jgi:hypothetical protein
LGTRATLADFDLPKRLRKGAIFDNVYNCIKSGGVIDTTLHEEYYEDVCTFKVRKGD